MKRIKSLMPIIVTLLITAALVFIIFKGSKPNTPITGEINNSCYFCQVQEIRDYMDSLYQR